VRGFSAHVAALQQRYDWLPPALVARYASAYGSRIEAVLAGASGPAGMGREILPGLYEIEVRYLMANEWARCAEDVLWRRSKLGLHLGAGSAATLDAWMAGEAKALRESGNGAAPSISNV
jgi:glycerol-3-phosphate dehydrogenase